MPSPGDLSPLFGPPPGGPAQPMTYLQGTVTAWDSLTLENTIDVGGGTMTDLPVLGVAEAASITAGSVVGIALVGSVWAIIGRFVIPNTTEATDAITQLSQKIYSDTVAATESINSAPYVDLATFGPQVTATIGVSGRALVLLSCLMQTSSTLGGTGSAMGFTVTGPSSVSASAENSLYGRVGADVSITLFATRLVELSGLTPGENVFTAKYSTGALTPFGNRTITVFAL